MNWWLIDSKITSRTVWHILGKSFVEAEDGHTPEPAIPEFLLDAGNFGHAAQLLDDTDLDDEGDTLGGGNGGIPHRHPLGDAERYNWLCKL